jgi:gamma-glutamylcyclotransferase (GGCT)/AIG2-like uncharacterized protein YtfP
MKVQRVVPEGVALEPGRALVVYGTLLPGETNFDVVADIEGSWFEVAIRGTRFWVEPDVQQDQIWGQQVRYPGFRADDTGQVIPAAVLVSEQLDLFWPRLDDFEGPGYRRVPVTVWDRPGVRDLGHAFVYEAREQYWRELHQP